MEPKRPSVQRDWCPSFNQRRLPRPFDPLTTRPPFWRIEALGAAAWTDPTKAPISLRTSGRLTFKL
ncbi:MAG: hypothetical protein ACTS5F_00655 [Candidatus Hodgkinia cicadicola]